MLFFLVESIPEEFSIVASFRLNNMDLTNDKLSIPLLTIYNKQAREVLGLYVGPNSKFLLSDNEARTPVEKATSLESFAINDTK